MPNLPSPTPPNPLKRAAAEEPLQRADKIALASVLTAVIGVPVTALLTVWAGSQSSVWVAYSGMAAFLFSYAAIPASVIGMLLSFRHYREARAQLCDAAEESECWADERVDEADERVEALERRCGELSNQVQGLHQGFLAGHYFTAHLAVDGTCLTRSGRGCTVTLTLYNGTPFDTELASVLATNLVIDGQPASAGAVQFEITRPSVPGGRFGGGNPIRVTATVNRKPFPAKRLAVPVSVGGLQLTLADKGQHLPRRPNLWSVEGCFPVVEDEAAADGAAPHSA